MPDVQGLNGPELSALLALYRHDTVSLAKIACEEGLSVATLRNVLRSLQAKGLVEKPDPTTDESRPLVRLSLAGRAAVAGRRIHPKSD